MHSRIQRAFKNLQASTAFELIIEAPNHTMSGLEKITAPAMTNLERSFYFYQNHYDWLVDYILVPGEEITLGDVNNRVCRFCDKSNPEVTFEKIAHAVPDSLGNKSLFSAYECDVCNAKFGQGIENDLGNWSKPMRTLARIKGKRGVPALQKGGGKGWSVRYAEDEGYQIKSYEDDPVFSLDEPSERLTLYLKRDKHVPLAVLKAFWKIAYTIMPEKELPNFKHLLEWIRETPHVRIFDELKVAYAFQPGPVPSRKIFLTLLRRKSHVSDYPYAFLVMRYGNETFQIPLPTANELGKPLKEFVRWQYPPLVDETKFGKEQYNILDWSSEIARSDDAIFTLHAKLIKTTDHRAGQGLTEKVKISKRSRRRNYKRSS